MKNIVILLMLSLPLASIAQVQFAVTDADGSVIEILGSSVSSTADTTCVQVLNVRWVGSTELPIEDVYGRCTYRVSGTALEPRSAVWPLPAASKARRSAALLALADRLVDKLITVERWQATPALVSIKDRSAEVQDLKDRIAELRSVWLGR